MSAPKDQTILGHDIPKARLTAAGWAWGALYLGLPVLLLGNAVDLIFQWTLGWCIGVWCMV
ncbi:hypothetical protein ACHEXL_04890 [Limnohabitans sp. yimb22184]|uniref:hypothetical protein n=1 Tax=Limnohabitans sp. YIMB22184 TaxID=3374104 RepID=UPI003A8B3ECE